MDDIYGIIPVSKFKECKTRLSPFLSEDEREKLLKVMLKDVTDTLRKYTDKIIIISADEDVLEYAKSLNLSVLKENENSSTPTDKFVDINNDESSENILVDVGDNEYLVAVDSASKELIINENISDSNKYIKIDYEEILPVISDIEDYKNLSIPQYISLYNKISPHIDTNMSYSELLSLASSININDLKSNYNEFIKIQKNND